MVVRRVFLRSAILVLFLWLLVFSNLLNNSSNERSSVFVKEDGFGIIFRLYLKWNGRLTQNDRTLGHACGRKFFFTRISIYPNSQASFQLSRLLESGDVCPNPGPTTAAHNPAMCSVCKKTVAKTHRAINCDSFQKWCHIKCGGVTAQDYLRFQLEEEISWICPICTMPTVLQPCLGRVDAPTRASEVFTDLKQITNTRGLKIAHININGLLNKMSEIKFLLQEMRFDILGLTESHLNNNTDNGQLSVGGYNLVRKDRTCDNSWGGCVMYYKEGLNDIQRK
ncbi:hypothetical protein P5673_023132 [Acropora cervicornis]|uniref:PHD-type domain-containing protein n=1 Tax=Acropora cervicornis TaxID=6130 RepID=A0AAD9Q5J2_ACRCE|nr:hypothetical protein P5673_023132 [Acropora cervicornis]